MTHGQGGGTPEWDGETLSAWLASGSEKILCKVGREAINRISRYDDAIGIEIGRYRAEIFELLRPVFLKKIALRAAGRTGGAGTVMCLAVQDIDRSGLSSIALHDGALAVVHEREALVRQL
jgi:hypothetical protein